MKKVNRLATLALMTMLILVLVGCGGNNTPDSTEEQLANNSSNNDPKGDYQEPEVTIDNGLHTVKLLTSIVERDVDGRITYTHSYSIFKKSHNPLVAVAQFLFGIARIAIFSRY